MVGHFTQVSFPKFAVRWCMDSVQRRVPLTPCPSTECFPCMCGLTAAAMPAEYGGLCAAWGRNVSGCDAWPVRQLLCGWLHQSSSRDQTGGKACSQELRLGGQDFFEHLTSRITGHLHDRGWFRYHGWGLPVRLRSASGQGRPSWCSPQLTTGWRAP